MLSTVKNRNKLFGSLRELRRIKSLENQNQTYSQKVFKKKYDNNKKQGCDFVT